MKPNLKEMSLKELKAYVLAHADDDSAFYTYVDRSKAERKWSGKMPRLNSIEELDNYPELLELIRRDGEGKSPDEKG